MRSQASRDVEPKFTHSLTISAKLLKASELSVRLGGGGKASIILVSFTEARERPRRKARDLSISGSSMKIPNSSHHFEPLNIILLNLYLIPNVN